ncbi:twin-arginine translocation signal domain-containing protein [Halorientalis brevis]|uniref:Twin-arginine translocation signal domain-containing protein n=1 Tax=Halorientalis brevis TaxID=1126241 RepID=A0ABD6CGM5_9EURY|nr:twin-arginine translocation signal domain-containing protein [Halorientalis brevis]
MTYETPQIDHEERRQFLKVLGIAGAAAAGSELTMSELRNAVESDGAAELAAMGQAIRADLSADLDAALIEAELANIGAQIDRVPALTAMGVPAADSTVYQEVATPVWRVYDHLAEADFFAAAEANLPAFTTDHIESTARELVTAEPLAAALTDAGFDEAEMTALISNVATNRGQLARWMPTKEIPDGVEFDLEHVAPLHQRAMGGVALWIEDLDTRLWQMEYLLTDDLIERGMWDVKSMLGGANLVSLAARDVAGAADLTDSQFTAALTAGTASMIMGQEDLTNDLYRITDDVRAPRAGGD